MQRGQDVVRTEKFGDDLHAPLERDAALRGEVSRHFVWQMQELQVWRHN